MTEAYERRVEPLAGDLRTSEWPGGGFATGGRALTPRVEGVIRTPDHVLFSTLEGGARRLKVHTDCGHRFEGPDTAGRLSLAPAERERRLEMTDVRARWASVSLSADLVAGLAGRPVELRPFTNVEDAFAVSVLRRLALDQDSSEGIDPLFGETVSAALALHLLRRDRVALDPAEPRRLTVRRLKRVVDHIEDRLADPIRVQDLARLAGLSDGHFHRAFRAATGLTPMAWVTRARMRRAAEILRHEGRGVTETALRVGYQSPARFARAFRSVIGVNPSRLRD